MCNLYNSDCNEYTQKGPMKYFDFKFIIFKLTFDNIKILRYFFNNVMTYDQR